MKKIYGFAGKNWEFKEYLMSLKLYEESKKAK
jgi:hypothetical protein